MPKFAANLSWLFTELPFAARFDAAAAAGFAAVEFLFPYDHAPAAVSGWARGAGVEVVLFNTPPWNGDGGERGLAALPGREAEFADSIERALDYAAVLGCTRLHAMAGMGGARAAYVDNLRSASARAASAGVTLLIEPIGAATMPGYHLRRIADAHAVVAQVPGLRIQADLFHIDGEGDDTVAALQTSLADIGHVQVAAPGDRGEPDTPACARWFAVLDALGYDGWVGCEYRPRGATTDGLGWLKP